jgi:hypothetical protein
MTTFYVTQRTTFTWKVEAESEEEAIAIASDMDWDNAYEFWSDNDYEVSEHRESMMMSA